MSKKFRNRSTGFKIMTLALSVVLVVVVSVAGTLAWLSAESGVVKNTFTSAELFANPNTQFTLWEHQAVANADGTYTLNSTKVQENTYEILPGVAIPKDPTVDVVDLEEYAYLYIRVTNHLPDGLSYTIDSNNWELLTGYTDIYVFKGAYAEGKSVSNNIIPATDDAKVSFTANILDKQTISVLSTYNGTADTNLTLSFTAYMVQATGNGNNAADAFVNAFPGGGTKN